MRKYLIAGLALAVLLILFYLTNLRSERDQLQADLADSQVIIGKMTQEAALAKQSIEARDSVDQQFTEKLTNALADNQKLRDSIAAGTQRVYVKANCPVPGLPSSSGTTGLDHGASVELTADARQDYLHLRDQLISDNTKLAAAQAYISQVCQRKPE